MKRPETRAQAMDILERVADRPQANIIYPQSFVERVIANVKNWRILHTDYRRPLGSFATTISAAVGLLFYSLA